VRFAGKACLVTGGASGIGRAVCERLAREGAAVAVVDVDAAGGEETVRSLDDIGKTLPDDVRELSRGPAEFLRADVSVEDEVAAAVASFVASFGGVDLLVNNAATMAFLPVVDLPADEWDRVLGVNLRGPFLLAKHCLPHMQAGSIVNVTSIHSARTTPLVAAYAASKGGLDAFTRALAQEVKGRDVRVNAVAPGSVDTPMLWSNPNVGNGDEVKEHPVGDPAEIAAVVAFLASDDAAFVNGATIMVDGGRQATL
jgi:glucose 1-dehydrogenase